MSAPPRDPRSPVAERPPRTGKGPSRIASIRGCFKPANPDAVDRYVDKRVDNIPTDPVKHDREPEPYRDVRDVFQDGVHPDPDRMQPEFDALSSTVPRSAEKDLDTANIAQKAPLDNGLSLIRRMALPRQLAMARIETSGTLQIRMDRPRQEMLGIGFSNGFYTNWWHDHPNRDKIYDMLFEELRPSVLRFRNTFELNEGNLDHIQADVVFYQKAKEKLKGSEKPTVLLSSWTPPRELKQNNSLFGDTTTPSVLKKKNGRFIYDEFADWWARSIAEYNRRGLSPDWISLQNEPDFPAPHHGMLLADKATAQVPGYYEAGVAVHKKLQEKFPTPPKMIGPECFRMDSYLAQMPFAGGGIYMAAANHLYASGDKRDPYSFSGALFNARLIAERKQVDLFMSEFAKLGRHEYQDPLRLAITMHMSLTVGEVTSYLHWDGAWARDLTRYADHVAGEQPGVGADGRKKEEQEGTLLLVDDPYNRQVWKSAGGFEVLQSFYWFKHFSRYIRRGTRRVETRVSVRNAVVHASAWAGPAANLTLILINAGGSSAVLDLQDLPDSVATQKSEIYYSTLDDGWKYAGALRRRAVSLLPRSITSIHCFD